MTRGDGADLRRLREQVWGDDDLRRRVREQVLALLEHSFYDVDRARFVIDVDAVPRKVVLFTGRGWLTEEAYRKGKRPNVVVQAKRK